jgi:hypothetical protein
LDAEECPIIMVSFDMEADHEHIILSLEKIISIMRNEGL